MFGHFQADIGYLAGVLAVIQSVPYIVSIFHGETKPSRAAYTIWSVAEIVAISSYIAAGARTTIWFGLATALTAVIILALSIKRGMGGASSFDLICLFLSGLVIAAWIYTESPIVAVYASVGTTVLGYLPVIKKAHVMPETENFNSWVICFIATLFNLGALTSLHLYIIVPPIASALGAGLVFWFLLYSRKLARAKRRLLKYPG